LLHGLVQAAAHNEKCGVVDGFSRIKMRYIVRLDDGQTLAIKSENLTVQAGVARHIGQPDKTPKSEEKTEPQLAEKQKVAAAVAAAEIEVAPTTNTLRALSITMSNQSLPNALRALHLTYLIWYGELVSCVTGETAEGRAGCQSHAA
jgi:hypothetical protein